MVPLLRRARSTQQHNMLEKAFDAMEDPLVKAVRKVESWKPEPIPEALTNQLAQKAKDVLVVLKISFEDPKKQDAAKRYLTRLRNLAKMVKAWAGAKNSDELTAILKKQSTKSRDAWQKYIEYRNEVLGLLNFFDTEIEGNFSVDHFHVTLVTSARTDWDDEKIGAVQWVLRQGSKILSRAGFGAFATGKILAFPSGTVPGGRGGVAAWYNIKTHLMSLAAGRDPNSTLKTLIHEYGHKVYYEGIGNRGRASWEKFFEATQGDIGVNKIISTWENYITSHSSDWEVEKYGRYYTYYRGWMKKIDPEITMWTDMVMDELDVKEDFQALTGAPKKGVVPGLDQLIARKGEANVFLYPVTAYSATTPSELFAEVFSYYLTAGPGRIPEIVRDQFRRAVPMLKQGSRKRAMGLEPTTS